MRTDRETIAMLSPREKECLRLTHQRLSTKEVGLALGCSWTTVKTHLDRARTKAGVHDTRRLASLLAIHEADDPVLRDWTTRMLRTVYAAAVLLNDVVLEEERRDAGGCEQAELGVCHALDGGPDNLGTLRSGLSRFELGPSKSAPCGESDIPQPRPFSDPPGGASAQNLWKSDDFGTAGRTARALRDHDVSGQGATSPQAERGGHHDLIVSPLVTIAALMIGAPAALAVVLGSLLFLIHALQTLHSGGPLLP